MPLEAKRCRHAAVAIPEVRVSRGIAVVTVTIGSKLLVALVVTSQRVR